MATSHLQHDSESIRLSFSKFFYSQETPYGLAIMRMFLPLVLFYLVVQRWSWVRELYSSDGATTPLSMGFNYPDLFPEFSAPVAVALFSLLGFFLLTSAAGWYTRFSLVAATVLYTYFNMMDCLSTMTKYSVIATHVLLILSLSNCGALWSIDAWRRSRSQQTSWPGEPSGQYPRGECWPRRLMQLMIAIVYFGAAITKLHTIEFFTGDQLLFWAMTNANHPHPLGEYMTLYPVLFVISAYISVVWEVLFVFLVWKGWWRPFMLVMGVGFHLMTTLVLGLYIFPLVAVSTYFAFLEERDVQRLAQWFRRLQRRIAWLQQTVSWAGLRLASLRLATTGPVPSFAVYPVLLLLVAFTGIVAERHLDLYQERQAGGPLALKTIAPEVVQRMLAPPTRIRPQDKILTFQTGTTLFGGILADRKQLFEYQEPVVVQVFFNPPHEDMWVECNLHDSSDRMVDRMGHVVAREMMRTHFTYVLDRSMMPGDYFLVLMSAGQEVARRKITLRGDPTPAPLAN